MGKAHKKPKVRPLAICIFRHEGHILVAENFDRVKRETFYRPPGGGIKFGEHSREAVEREIMEELGAQVTRLRFLGVLENTFEYEGKPGHEIVMVYDGSFTDPQFYRMDRPLPKCVESNGEEFIVVWKPVELFKDAHPPLYPAGLYEMITGAWWK